MSSYVYDLSDSKSKMSLLSKTFLYLFIGIMYTAILAIVLGLVFTYGIFGTVNTDAIYNDAYNIVNINPDWMMGLVVTMIISSIALIITSIVVNVAAFKNSKRLKVPMLIYCTLMGVLLSSFVVLLPWQVLGISFLITSLAFGVMAAIGALSKGNLSILGVVGSGLFFGALIISLFGFLFMFIGGMGAYMTIYWIVSFATFGGMMLITIFDIWNVKKMSEAGQNSENLALYCAFNLYVDFIYILVRILYFVAMIWLRNKD